MKKILLVVVLVATLGFTGAAKAEGDTVVFSATSDKSNYQVGDDVVISLNVDAGPYASTLSVIDFKVAISDTSVVEPGSNTPLTLGSIFTNTVTQSYADGVISGVVFIDPNNKPSQRSGVVGTLTLKALKAGESVISYDSIQATEENNELGYVTTTASSLTVTVEGVEAATTQTTSESSSTSASTATKTATPKPGSATTGPAEVIFVAILSGIVILFGLKLTKKINTSSRKI